MSDDYASARLERINAILQAVEFRCMRNRQIHNRGTATKFVRQEINVAEMMEIIDLARPR
jgi:hypothetical protein